MRGAEPSQTERASQSELETPPPVNPRVLVRALPYRQPHTHYPLLAFSCVAPHCRWPLHLAYSSNTCSRPIQLLTSGTPGRLGNRIPTGVHPP